MTTIDLGAGQSVQRRHLPKNMQHCFDEASAALSAAQTNIRSWVKPLSALQASADFSGTISCTAVGQSGLTYSLIEVGGALLVDQRDLGAFAKLGFADVPAQQPTTGLRVGLVFLDLATSEYLRYDGTHWSPVILN